MSIELQTKFVLCMVYNQRLKCVSLAILIEKNLLIRNETFSV